MAMNGVLRPGHAALRVLDLDEGIEFYGTVSYTHLTLPTILRV